jgi:predicted  nucleic acid-binding Zn-ribbon protein
MPQTTQFEQLEKSIENLRDDVREMRKEFREDLMGLENEVKNLNGFRNRVVGVASAVSAAAAFVMSVVVAYVTKKL